MRYLYILVALLILSCNACKEPEARKPISKKSGNYLKESIERTKKLLEKENSLIEAYIKNDSVNNYISSKVFQFLLKAFIIHVQNSWCY